MLPIFAWDNLPEEMIFMLQDSDFASLFSANPS
jgi:hypothetical protein